MRLGAVLVAAWALALAPALAPVAQAGSEADPEVPGIPDLEDPALDFLGAWLEPELGGIRFTVKFGGADAPPADHYYGLAFTWGGERMVAAVAFDDDGAMHTDVRPVNWERQGVRGPETFVGRLEDARFRAGEPAYVSARIPYEALPGLEPGQVLIDLAGYTGFYDRSDRSWHDVDWRVTGNAYVVKSAFLPASIERNLGWIAAVSIVLLLGVIVVLVILLRRRARDALPPLPPPMPPATSVRAREPGDPKFRLDPRK